MTTKVKATLIVLGALLLIGIGYALATWRHQSVIAGYDKREAERMQQVAAGEAEQNNLRGQNEQLRKHVAELTSMDEALKASAEARGGQIAAEVKNLEKINEDLKNDQAVISAPTDKCVRCRRFSERAVATGQISKPLTCKDECSGAAQ